MEGTSGSASEDTLQALVDEVLADANKRAQQAKQEAERKAERLREKSAERVEKEKQRLLSDASARAEAEERRIKERLELDCRRERLKNGYAFMDVILQKALEELREGEGQDPDVLAELAAEAVRAMEGEEALLLTVSPDTKERLTRQGIEAWCQKVVQRAKRDVRLEIKGDPEVSGGVLVTAKTGGLRYDNTFQARLSRNRESILSEMDPLLSQPEEEGRT